MKLSEKLKQLQKDVILGGYERSEINDGFNRVIDHAIELEGRVNETPPGWISIKDRLPEESVDVLVWERVYLTPPIQAFWRNKSTPRWYGSRELRDSINGYCEDWELHFKPTHWMPLPSPPNQSQE